MPRKPRIIIPGTHYHVLNRAVSRLKIFERSQQYQEFCELLTEAVERFRLELNSFCIMPNHWHLVVKPESAPQLSGCLAWITATHSRRHHLREGTVGHGPLYQGRYKHFPIESENYLATVIRYVERNAVTGNLVRSSRDWRWSSAHTKNTVPVQKLEFQRHKDWHNHVDSIQSGKELEMWQESLCHELPFGSKKWLRGLETAYSIKFKKKTGRPKKVPDPISSA